MSNLSRRDIEAAEGKLKVRIGEEYIRFEDFHEILRQISSGKIPSDAEVFLPYEHGWLSTRDFELKVGSTAYRAGGEYHELRTTNRARRLINSGKIPTNAEIFSPADGGWLSLQEYGKRHSDIRPPKLTPEKRARIEKQKRTHEKIVKAASTTWRWVWGYTIFIFSIAVLVWVVGAFEKGIEAPKLFQLALLVGAFVLPVWGWKYFIQKVDRWP